MEIIDEIESQKQLIARCEKSLAWEKLKKRRADTRLKIELGGLVIKSKMNHHSKFILLGALDHSLQLIQNNASYLELFESKGRLLF